MGNLDVRQVKAAVFLAQGFSSKDTAAEVGVTVQSICEWRKKAEFKALVNRMMEEHIADALGHINSLASEAVSIIENLMDSDSESIRLKAASKILGMLGAEKGGHWGWSIGETNEDRLRLQKIHDDMNIL